MSPGGGMVDAHVSGACAARRAGSIPVLGTKNPVRGNSEGIFLFPCPHRVRNFMEKGSDFSLPERQNQIIFVILYKPIPNKRRTIQILM